MLPNLPTSKELDKVVSVDKLGVAWYQESPPITITCRQHPLPSLLPQHPHLKTSADLSTHVVEL